MQNQHHIYCSLLRLNIPFKLNSKCTISITYTAVCVAKALYYTAVELEISKNITNKHTSKQTDRETEISKTEATLIPWIARLSGPIVHKLQLSVT